MPEEIRLRLLLRAIDRFGHEGPAELGKVEALLAALDRAGRGKRRRGRRPRLKQTLAGALVSLIDGRIRIEPAPPRRRRSGTEAGPNYRQSSVAASISLIPARLNHPRKTPVPAPLFERESR